jgi:basic amino acid/polyamine antiporter, APA family
VFTTLVLMTGITSAIPYAFSVLAQIKWRIADRRAMHGARFARDMTVAVLALVFSILFIYYSRNTDANGFEYWARSCWPESRSCWAFPSTLRSEGR